ncbi:ATP-binding protein [Neomoorella carbonis]|uniref:ATP-binding protein n=1 Tax=Neomoorella carbonis TaxID=3062783 RepID=UPI0038736E33
MSYISLPRQGAEFLFQVISERNECDSVIINTNLDFYKWEEIFGDRILAAALVDRVTFKSHILNMNAESYSLKQRHKAMFVVCLPCSFPGEGAGSILYSQRFHLEWITFNLSQVTHIFTLP